MRTVAAIPAAGLLAGSAVGLVVPDFPPVIGFSLLCVAAVAALWAWCASQSRALGIAVCVAFFGGGTALSATAWQRASRPPLRAMFEHLAAAERRQATLTTRVLPQDDEAAATIEGVILADASPAPSGVSLSVAVDAMDGLNRGVTGELGGVIVTVVGSIAPGRIGEWTAGRRVRFPAQLRRPARYLNPGVPDHERALARRGTTLVGTVKSGALVDVLAPGSWLDEWLAASRGYARRSIAAAVGRWSSRSAAIVSAIVIGDRAGLDDDVQRQLQVAGTYHVLAISGGNIAILAGLLLGIFRLAGVLGRTAMLAAMAALVGYAQLVGGGASVDRATLMAVVYLAARAIDHRSPAVNSLAFVAACLVATDPLSVADPSFLLTFGATLALLVAVPAVRRQPLPRVVRPALLMLAASAAAETLLFPIGAFVFSRVTFAGLVLNFLAIPLMAVVQIAGMVVVPAAAVSTHFAGACGWIAHAGAEGLVHSAGLVRFAPGITWRVAAPNVAMAAIYYIAVAMCWTLWRRRAQVSGSGESRAARSWRRGALVAAALTAIWILAEPWTLLAARGDGRLHVTFIDVGQGDSIFVRFPAGTTLLVDAGGLAASSSFDIGDRVVAPVLREAGVRRLDYLALTHGDPDHIGGAASILAEFRPHETWEGIPVPRLAPLTMLRTRAEMQGARWLDVRSGDHFVIDEVDVRVLHPAEPDWERQKVRNDDSIVIDLGWRDVSVLLTGDIGRAVEQVLPALAPARLRVIKVPHHGSLTSSTEAFVRRFQPRVAVASAGRSNHFGHPARAVLERYEAVGAEVFRTDRDGAVTIDTDGYSLSVQTYLGRRLELSAPYSHHEGTKNTKHTKP